MDHADPESHDDAKTLKEDSRPMGPHVGELIGRYHVEERIGLGGMGEVFRARDTRLGRHVAVKTSLERFSDRFEREARAISSLNHPHICTLYDVGPNYLVMELVEGDTLASRIKRGSLPIEETLRYGKQIAAALAAAHAKKIVHRDLKPANIMVTKMGIKVLDFGIAKSDSDETVQTVSSGQAIGTPAYMAPEQRRGEACDARTDIYSLGVVLYEMATGMRPSGEPIVLSDPYLAHVIERCVAPDRHERWQSASDVERELAWCASRPQPLPVTTQSSSRRFWFLAGGAAAVAAVVTAALVLWMSREPEPGLSVRFSYTPGAGVSMMREVPAISPDGKYMVFAGHDASGQSLWLRRLDEPNAHRLEGTEEAVHPFWSPDSTFIGFMDGGRLRKIAVTGGPAQTICNSRGGLGAAWSSTGEIIFNPVNRAALMRVRASGGTPEVLTELDSKRQENSHRWPAFLPDGRHFLFTARSSLKQNTAVYVGSLDSKETKRILTEQSNAIYIPQGFVLFARDRALMAQKFDLRRLEVSGEAFAVTGGMDVETASAWGFFSASADGSTLVVSDSGPPQEQLFWFDRSGTRIGALAPPGRYTQARVSPDGTRVAYVANDSDTGNRDVWLLDIASGGRTRLTEDPATDWFPVWSPDGNQIAFASDRDPKSSIYIRSVDAGAEEVRVLRPEGKGGVFPTDWTSDGRIVYSWDDPPDGSDIFALHLLDKKSDPLAVTRFWEAMARSAPDGKSFAYVSRETGAPEVYVQAFGRPAKVRVSPSGGNWPVWRPDGKELFYEAGGDIMSVDIFPGEPVRLGAPPRKLFRSCEFTQELLVDSHTDFDISRDGKRFLLSCRAENSSPRSVTIATNWFHPTAQAQTNSRN